MELQVKRKTPGFPIFSRRAAPLPGRQGHGPDENLARRGTWPAPVVSSSHLGNAAQMGEGTRN